LTYCGQYDSSRQSNLSRPALVKAFAECLQDGSERFRLQAQNEDPKAGLTIQNVLVFRRAQFTIWIGMKVRPDVMGCDVSAILTISCNHRNNHAQRNMQSEWR
jgi:hypothetical protein